MGTADSCHACPEAIVLEKKYGSHHKEALLFSIDGAMQNLSMMKSFVIPVLASAGAVPSACCLASPLTPRILSRPIRRR